MAVGVAAARMPPLRLPPLRSDPAPPLFLLWSFGNQRRSHRRSDLAPPLLRLPHPLFPLDALLPPGPIRILLCFSYCRPLLLPGEPPPLHRRCCTTARCSASATSARLLYCCAGSSAPMVQVATTGNLGKATRQWRQHTEARESYACSSVSALAQGTLSYTVTLQYRS